MNLEVLLSTMYSSKDIIKKMNINSSCTIINQCDVEDYDFSVFDDIFFSIYFNQRKRVE